MEDGENGEEVEDADPGALESCLARKVASFGMVAGDDHTPRANIERNIWLFLGVQQFDRQENCSAHDFETVL